MLNSTITDFEALSINTTTDFEDLYQIQTILLQIKYFQKSLLKKINLRMTIMIGNLRMTIMIGNLRMHNDSHFENDNNDSQFESTNSNNMSISHSNVSVNTSHNWKTYREAKEKTKNLEFIIQSLPSPVKHIVKRNLANSVLTEVIVNTDSENIHEATVVSSIITYLKQLNK